MKRLTTRPGVGKIGLIVLASCGLGLAADGGNPLEPVDVAGSSSERLLARNDPFAAQKRALPERDSEGYWHVDFSLLASFPYGHPRGGPDSDLLRPKAGRLALLRPDESEIIDPPTEPGTGGAIPEEVTALDGKQVRLGGYMLPVKLEDGLATQFLILRNQSMCCFGRPPAPNEWIVARMKGKGVPSRMDTPLYFYGKLHVGEVFQHQVFTGLYELEVEKVSGS
ncbi:MAG TPA: DUF3299 domain-containing protein [Lacunisphaera sp.]|nr:DUF3299 domain-containing protein [Lacunisphaera sp.]